jgi:hypothetical protein
MAPESARHDVLESTAAKGKALRNRQERLRRAKLLQGQKLA